MQTFTLTIELGNDAMQTPEDVAAVLRKVAGNIEDYNLDGEFDSKHATSILDQNGNKVGSYQVKGKA